MDQNPQIKDKIDEARKMAGNIRFNEVSSSLARKSKLWDKIEESTQGKEVHMPNSSRRIFLYAASVAAIITFVSILLWPDTSTIFRADDLVAEIVTLPSDSKVRVEPASRISFKEDKWKTSRDVVLDGFAHFDVTKGVPFTVQTDNGQVRVLGTEFDVISNSTSFYVKVDEGRVQTSSGNYNEILTADMSFFKKSAVGRKIQLD